MEEHSLIYYKGGEGSISHCSSGHSPAVTAAMHSILSDMPQLNIQPVQSMSDVQSQALQAVSGIAAQFGGRH